MKQLSITITCIAVAAAICVGGLLADDAKSVKTSAALKNKAKKEATSKVASRSDQQKSLAPFAELIGEWRGVGQPKRGSRKGAWFETSEWIWDFSTKQVAISGAISKGKLAKAIHVTAGEKKDQFLIELTTPDDKVTKFTAKTKDKLIVGESAADDNGNVQRLTITKLNEKRMLLLLEKRKSAQSSYSRVAGVGYTRAGTSIAVAGNSGPVCVVTGGKGTIKVSHKGKTYYVCCTGCKSAFDDDPEGILAEYHESLKKKKKP